MQYFDTFLPITSGKGLCPKMPLILKHDYSNKYPKGANLKLRVKRGPTVDLIGSRKSEFLKGATKFVGSPKFRPIGG